MPHPFDGRRLRGLLGIVVAALGMTCASALAADDPAAARPAFRASESVAIVAGPLDIDDNGVVDALTDGLLLLRYFMGIRGDPLVAGALGQNAQRHTADAIAAYIASFNSGAPSGCSVVAQPTSSVGSPLPAGTNVQLTASCQSGATSFIWSTGATGPSITVAPTQTTAYVAIPTTPQFVGSSVSSTVYVTGSSTGIATGCSVRQYPNTAQSTVNPNTQVDLVVQCTNGFPPTICAWSGGIATTACNVRIAAGAVTTTYTVTPSNQFGASSQLSTTVNVAGAATDVCPQGSLRYTVTWPASGQLRLETSGFAGQIAAFKVVVPMTFNPPLNTSHLGFISLAEVPGTPPTPREVTVSTIACDFQSGNYRYNGTGFAATSPSINFTANNPNPLSVGGEFNMNSGETIYINVRNSQNGVPACNDFACNMLFDFATPNRY
jgi:hypothetical protein